MKISQIIQSKYDAFRPNRYGLKPYLINDGKRHPFAIICPGGGYGMVCSAGEGKPFAEELNKLGYHAFVVYYRVKEKARYPHPQEDLKRAIEEVFAHKDEWKLDTDSWSLWGSSAGGHLVASYCLEDWGTPKPTGIILCYPVISMGEHTHMGSKNNLLGKNASEEMIKKLSVELSADENYPPAFMWYGTADDVVHPLNSKMLCDTLGKFGIACKVEQYEGIGHGAGLAKGTVAEPWFKNAVTFWESQLTDR